MRIVNTGGIDRAVRLIIGIGLLGLYGALEPPFRYLALLGVIPIATGLSGFCVAYHWFGISTARKPRSP